MLYGPNASLKYAYAYSGGHQQKLRLTPVLTLRMRSRPYSSALGNHNRGANFKVRGKRNQMRFIPSKRWCWDYLQRTKPKNMHNT